MAARLKKANITNQIRHAPCDPLGDSLLVMFPVPHGRVSLVQPWPGSTTLFAASKQLINLGCLTQLFNGDPFVLCMGLRDITGAEDDGWHAGQFDA